MKYKVIFDTNSIRNAESASDFLGGRVDLERFSKVSEIIVPDLVIDEIKVQKRKHLISKRSSFLSNPFHFLRGIDQQATKDFDIDQWILELEEKEKVSYTIISLTETGILEKMRRMCLDCEPPFEDGSDKGFKDTYIYFTVLEYLAAQKDERVFVVTKDDRLKKAFTKESRIKVIKGYEEFENYIDEYFKEPYFINRLKEEVDEEIEKAHIEDTWFNIEGNWVLKIIPSDSTYLVEVDFASKEIIGFKDIDFSVSISKLVASGSFTTTHEAVAELRDCVNFFSDDDIRVLFKGAIENNQIYSISTDEDVKEFFTTLYEGKNQILPEDTKDSFKHYFEIK